ncbi:GTP 3',8-cyclase MoaA [Corynebacterium sphenisci]|uniref:GTP 3',8-cyclase MoaA n=1 Tax=Corynebacterium sphenisci TaxID=191493 RepID=UPI0026E0F0FC|nr:GTP 3',8-cyclase MoaA [Corynebacterium sphenisci]MDO5730351.1 GTP 3',8-cyclase MoaA [Corynebacterium sphenisci]
MTSPDATTATWTPLADAHGRVARDLRVSLTDRCNLRCTYCMPAEGMPWIPGRHLLTDEEILRLIRIGVERLGIAEVRFTGGEPLLRPGLPDIIAEVAGMRTVAGERPGIAATTNAILLPRLADRLAAAGLDRVNISLDTVDRDRYARLTRRDRLPEVLEGLAAAEAAGLAPIKINAVLLPGINDADAPELLRFCLHRGYRLRFIEEMPLGPRGEWDRSRMITAEDILAMLRRDFELRPATAPRGSAPADRWLVAAGTDRAGRAHPAGEVGVIASVSAPFCGACDRTRLTADGAVRNCLFARRERPLRELLRGGAGDAELAAAWVGEMAIKAPGHGIDDPAFLQPDRGMSAIGG